ncbi:MAG TPA: response regulator transcription factor [Bacteroidales bacterium]|nr:response regulator transcription factor [Bacteroidales bacterium]
MKKNIVIIVDDHQLFREGLHLILQNFPFISKVYEAGSGEEFLAMLRAVQPDIIFMDVNMPGMNGIEATRKALEYDPMLRIIALSMYGDEDYYTRMINAGAKGFIVKNAGISELESAIHQVSEGKNYFSQEILSGILASINRKNQPSSSGGLSERETEVLFHICKGLSNQEIANQLFISKRTVDKHRENLLQKTYSRNTADLVMYAIKNGIVEI